MKPVLIVGIIGIVYLIFYRRFGVGIPCVFYKLTGFQCPGCGMTRAVAALSRANFAEAMHCNALSLTALPVILLYLLYRFITQEKRKRKEFYVWEYILMGGLLIVVVGYGIIRNIV